MIVNFLLNDDPTGGNSGSPTLNGKVELNRSIHVDSRYMLWVIDKVDNSQNLLDEVTIVK
ncbi:hypothetical protein PA7559_01530 [Pseudoalteromonas distincta]